MEENTFDPTLIPSNSPPISSFWDKPFFQKLKKYWKPKIILPITILALVLAGLPASLYLAQKPQDIRNFAKESQNNPEMTSSGPIIGAHFVHWYYCDSGSHYCGPNPPAGGTRMDYPPPGARSVLPGNQGFLQYSNPNWYGREVKDAKCAGIQVFYDLLPLMGNSAGDPNGISIGHMGEVSYLVSALNSYGGGSIKVAPYFDTNVDFMKCSNCYDVTNPALATKLANLIKGYFNTVPDNLRAKSKDGRSIVGFWTAQPFKNLSAENVSNLFAQVRSQSGYNFYLVLGEGWLTGGQYANTANVDGFMTWVPPSCSSGATNSDNKDGSIAYVMPGFWNGYSQCGNVSRGSDGVSTFRDGFQNAKNANPHMILITTWNGYEEGSQIARADYSSLGMDVSGGQDAYMKIINGGNSCSDPGNGGAGGGSGAGKPLTVKVVEKGSGDKYNKSLKIREIYSADCPNGCNATCSNIICQAGREINYDPTGCGGSGCGQWSDYTANVGYYIAPVSLPAGTTVTKYGCGSTSKLWTPGNGGAECTIEVDSPIQKYVITGYVFLDNPVQINALKNNESAEPSLSSITLTLLNVKSNGSEKAASYDISSKDRGDRNFRMRDINEGDYKFQLPEISGYKLIDCTSIITPKDKNVPADYHFFYCNDNGVTQLMRWTPNGKNAYRKIGNGIFSLNKDTLVDFPMMSVPTATP